MLKKRRVLTQTADSNIGLAYVDSNSDGALWIWGTGFLMAISIALGLYFFAIPTPLGDYAYIPGLGFIVGGFAVGLRLIGGAVDAVLHWLDERDAQAHVWALAALKRRQLAIQVATVNVGPQSGAITVRQNGKETVLEPELPVLIDPAAVESKAQALKWLGDSESKRPPGDRADKVMRWEKMGWTPDAWTRARDSLKPFVESNPPGYPKGTYCVAADFLTVEDLRAGVDEGRVLPSPSGALCLKVG